MPEPKRRVLNTHTAKVAGIRPGETAWLPEWEAEHVIALGHCVPVDASDVGFEIGPVPEPMADHRTAILHELAADNDRMVALIDGLQAANAELTADNQALRQALEMINGAKSQPVSG